MKLRPNPKCPWSTASGTSRRMQGFLTYGLAMFQTLRDPIRADIAMFKTLHEQFIIEDDESKPEQETVDAGVIEIPVSGTGEALLEKMKEKLDQEELPEALKEAILAKMKERLEERKKQRQENGEAVRMKVGQSTGIEVHESVVKAIARTVIRVCIEELVKVSVFLIAATLIIRWLFNI